MPNASSLFHDSLLKKVNDLIKLHFSFIGNKIGNKREHSLQLINLLILLFRNLWWLHFMTRIFQSFSSSGIVRRWQTNSHVIALVHWFIFHLRSSSWREFPWNNFPLVFARLKSSSSPASLSNSCSGGLTKAGITSATNLLTSLGEAGAFPPPVFLLQDDVSHAPLSTEVSAASSILEADWGLVWYR